MAGSVLIGVLLLGCLLFAYTRMSELKDTEHKVEVSEQAKDFNQDYETYNRKNITFDDDTLYKKDKNKILKEFKWNRFIFTCK